MFTAAVVSALQVTEDGFTMADLNQDGLSFRELMEWVRVSPMNELYGSEKLLTDMYDARVAMKDPNHSLRVNPNGHIPWFHRSQFNGYERDEFGSWATEPIDVELGAFAAVTDDFGTAGLLELMTEGEQAFRDMLTSLPGDFNNDGVVDLGDYTVWRDNFGAPAGTLPNDVAGTDIGLDQYTEWKAFFGSRLSPPAAVQVPEPTGAMLMAGLASLLLVAGRIAK
ncbi:hypothetical protein [Aeoliella mucimassa]|uniref:PEP-CTERM protein-sorting domain-containing protein n=1 Tax=Aeoliella mucimassa TaxID=2527972 RepID=A0A518AWK3_9BACT|nr:hypothetical protein [Aeoliella mucimassa]QDU59115.1 hypothetical protein Pan181_53560 [Aeoliella mucimassa]